MLVPGPVYVGRGSYVKPTLYSGQGCARLGPATGGAEAKRTLKQPGRPAQAGRGRPPLFFLLSQQVADNVRGGYNAHQFGLVFIVYHGQCVELFLEENISRCSNTIGLPHAARFVAHHLAQREHLKHGLIGILLPFEQAAAGKAERK